MPVAYPAEPAVVWETLKHPSQTKPCVSLQLFVVLRAQKGKRGWLKWKNWMSQILVRQSLFRAFLSVFLAVTEGLQWTQVRKLCPCIPVNRTLISTQHLINCCVGSTHTTSDPPSVTCSSYGIKKER